MCIINVAQNEANVQVETGNKFTVVLKSNGTVWRSSEIMRQELLEMAQMMI